MNGVTRSRFWERGFLFACALAAFLPLVVLFLLVGHAISDALGRFDVGFLVGYPSRKAALAGILPALVGSAYLILLTAVIALPLGVATAIYLEEYAGRSKMANLVEVNIANLAGVPSVIYGLLGLGLFVRVLGMGRSLLAGASTMALLVLPITIIASREALRAVPAGVREGCYALGATRWQAIRQVVLPAAFPGVLTGAILGISRAIGETAPLIVVGALTYVTFLPDSLGSPFTAMPIQIFNWVSRPQKAFLTNAAAGIVVLLLAMMLFNTVAVVLRHRYQKKF